MRSLILAAVAAFAFVSVASAAPAAGPYKLDAKGKCHAANGQFVAKSLCAPPTAPAKPKQCRDPKTGKFTKCPK